MLRNFYNYHLIKCDMLEKSIWSQDSIIEI